MADNWPDSWFVKQMRVKRYLHRRRIYLSQTTYFCISELINSSMLEDFCIFDDTKVIDIAWWSKILLLYCKLCSFTMISFTWHALINIYNDQKLLHGKKSCGWLGSFRVKDTYAVHSTTTLSCFGNQTFLSRIKLKEG